MSQQQPDPARPKPRRATTRSKTPPSNGSQPPEKAQARPASDDRKGWEMYWEKRQQPWRTEPEIDVHRQEELAKRRAIVPSIEQGIYPFGGMKLARADIEWLLATHENGRGPVDWNDESQRGRTGLDLHGADLRDIDLNNLPLARLKAGFVGKEWFDASNEQRVQAKVLMQRASLRQAHLEGADLGKAQLEGVDLYRAHLEEADLGEAQLEEANLYRAELKGANLSLAQLKGADLKSADLEGTYLSRVILSNERQIGPLLADVEWGNANLAIVDWSQVARLGDEWEAEQKKTDAGQKKESQTRLREYQAAVRANRQLAVALQTQGLNEDAARFAYRANLLQHNVLWFQMVQPNISLRQRIRKFGAWVFSHILNLVAGYGYRPERSFLAYLLVIFGFMGLYLLTSQFTTPHLRWDEALVLSLSSFHGRGFFTQTITLGDAYARLAVTEAVLGLFIEISFIATFTQRFFGK